MKKTFYILFILLFIFSCDDYFCPDQPSPKYGDDYDDYSTYENDGYESNTYIWYCENDRYRSVTYTRLDYCSEWEDSEYTSNCIGSLSKSQLDHMNKEERIKFYNNLKELK
tara:strand:+ start:11 stop:343 length:333 start_codon:yes stop_codon:yes gene_type:complete